MICILTKKVLTRINIRVSMLVFVQIQIRLEIGIHVTMILGFQYWALIWLGCQWFRNYLDDEPRIGTSIRRSLQHSANAKQEHFFSFLLETGLISSFRDRTFIFSTRSKDHWKKRTNKFLVFVKVQENGTNNRLIKLPPRAVLALHWSFTIFDWQFTNIQSEWKTPKYILFISLKSKAIIFAWIF